jgi:hypothetical protein
MYLCAFHVGKWEPDESVKDAYHRALNITDEQFRRISPNRQHLLRSTQNDGVDELPSRVTMDRKGWLAISSAISTKRQNVFGQLHLAETGNRLRGPATMLPGSRGKLLVTWRR